MPGILKKASNFTIGGLEKLFYRWGQVVTNHPYSVIFVCLLITCLSGLGFLRFSQEHRAHLLWIPPDSDYNVHEVWLEENFKRNRRDQMIIYTSDNVLTPKGLREMFEIHRAVSEITVDGKTFKDICTKIPIADIFHNTRAKREAAEENDVAPQYDEDYESLWANYDYNAEIEAENKKARTAKRIDYAKFGRRKEGEVRATDTDIDLPDQIYCDLVKNLNDLCLQTNLLDIWRYDEELINTATQQEIIDAVNLLARSPWLSYPLNYTKFLGQKVYNSSGHVVAAGAAQLYWNLALPDHIDPIAGIGVEVDIADNVTLAWEKEMIAIALNATYDNVKVFANAGRSFGDVSAEAIFFDGIKMASGYLLMFAYTILMLGRLNSLELRMYLAIAGIICIGMGMIIGMGLTLALGYPYTPMHAAMPFLALGIGIDDMFVLVQCWLNLEKSGEIQGLPLSQAMGHTLKHAGVAITITSLTDVFAFAVGSVTNMPGLESFCVATSICLSSIYFLVISWFAAFMSLDQKRIAAGRNGLVPCFKHKNFKPSSFFNFDLGGRVLSLYGKLLASWVFKLFVILSSMAFLGVGIWGSVSIRQKFDPVLLLPSDSYLRQFVSTLELNYPNDGWQAEVYIGEINHTHLAGMERLTQNLQELVDNKTHLRGMNSWWGPLKRFAANKKNFTSWEEFSNPTDFPVVLGDFLYSRDGSEFKYNFKWDGELSCREAAPPIIASKFTIDYMIFRGPEEHIPAKRAVETIVQESGVSDTAFSHVKIYAAWETDEIIGFEMWRNVGMSMGCVMIVTLLLLVNLRMALYVFLCVVCTLADIVGFLHFWDMTIDIITCVNIVLAIGLCVDYSVHIAHAYLVAKGTRHERSLKAVENIGPAVFNGGVTTFLALALLGLSTSQIFLTFFKVFLLTVVFGLWHGLFTLPVVLSLIGPMGHHDDGAEDEESSKAPQEQPKEPQKPTVPVFTKESERKLSVSGAKPTATAAKLKTIFKRRSSLCLEHVMKL